MVHHKREYSIRSVAEITGMNPITLRAWEQRYQLVVPKRGKNGRRIYTQKELDDIHEIVAWVNQGIPISQVKKLLQSHQKAEKLAIKKNISQWESTKKRMRKAIHAFNLQELDDLYNDVISIYPFDLVLKNIIKPLLIELGENWQKNQYGVADEHFFSCYIRNKVGARLLHLSSKQSRKHTLLLACLPGELHDLGLLCFALHAMESGFNCLMLGVGLPLAELERAIKIVKPSLSILYGCFNDEIFIACKKLVLKSKVRLAIVQREECEGYFFDQKNLYKLSQDFDMAINAIRKIITYQNKK